MHPAVLQHEGRVKLPPKHWQCQSLAGEKNARHESHLTTIGHPLGLSTATWLRVYGTDFLYV